MHIDHQILLYHQTQTPKCTKIENGYEGYAGGAYIVISIKTPWTFKREKIVDPKCEKEREKGREIARYRNGEEM